MPNSCKMGDKKWRPIVFTAVVIIAFTLILFLFVHRSSERRICEHPQDLLFTDEFGNSSCIREHTKGHCPSHMILYPQPLNDSVGVCDCDLTHNDRGLVYDNKTDQCYFIFSQAHCKFNEWLQPYKNSSTTPCSEPLCAKCVPNHCASLTQNNGIEWVQLNDGSCAELGRNHPSCRSSHEVIHFSKFHVYPSCENYPELKFHAGGIGVPPSRCPPGYSRTAFGHCALDFEF